MSDTCALFADIAERVKRGEVSPAVAYGAQRCATSDDIRARRFYFEAMAAFRSNVLDVADRGPGIRDMMLEFLRSVDAIAPTSTSMDAAMAKRAQQ
jgi:hypothetical protein